MREITPPLCRLSQGHIDSLFYSMSVYALYKPSKILDADNFEFYARIFSGLVCAMSARRMRESPAELVRSE